MGRGGGNGGQASLCHKNHCPTITFVGGKRKREGWGVWGVEGGKSNHFTILEKGGGGGEKRGNRKLFFILNPS